MQRDVFQEVAKIGECVFRQHVVVAGEPVRSLSQCAHFGDHHDLRQCKRDSLTQLIRSVDHIAEPAVDPVGLQLRRTLRYRQRVQVGQLERRRLSDLPLDPVVNADVDKLSGFRFGGAEGRLIEETPGLGHGHRRRRRGRGRSRRRAGAGRPAAATCGQDASDAREHAGAHCSPTLPRCHRQSAFSGCFTHRARPDTEKTSLFGSPGPEMHRPVDRPSSASRYGPCRGTFATGLSPRAATRAAAAFRSEHRPMRHETPAATPPVGCCPGSDAPGCSAGSRTGPAPDRSR